MDRASSLDYIGLPAAAALAHVRLTGKGPDARDSTQIQAIFNDIGYTLAVLCAIQAEDPETRMPVSLSISTLPGARIERGATTLRLQDGKLYRNLSVRRADFESAIAILDSTPLPWRTKSG